MQAAEGSQRLFLIRLQIAQIEQEEDSSDASLATERDGTSLSY